MIQVAEIEGIVLYQTLPSLFLGSIQITITVPLVVFFLLFRNRLSRGSSQEGLLEDLDGLSTELDR